ncbi:unnamed protein product [Prorocentrum cordatum]|uniref:Uncharacterized protein n=1 Tax=Prorocentrum cordatum TaxID=2364126 RepID=A0ABN9UWG3_9DINO|nr:unnamed protein product [Polarella glacialis]
MSTGASSQRWSRYWSTCSRTRRSSTSRTLATLPKERIGFAMERYPRRTRIWKRYREVAKLNDIVVAKIESHMSATDVMVAGVDMGDIMGNHLADEFVEGTAGEVKVPQNEVRKIRFAEEVATPMAAMEKEPSQQPAAKELNDGKRKLEKRKLVVADTKHVIMWDPSAEFFKREQ